MIDKSKLHQHYEKLAGPFKIVFPIWIVLFLFIISIFVIFLPSIKNNLIQQKKEMIQTLAESTLSLISEYNQKVLNGQLSISEAQNRAINQIRHLRYGSQGKDYFWIIDIHPFMVMHPYRPDLEGRDLTLFQDQHGNYPYVSMVKTVMDKGSGFVNYYWQWKDTPHKIVPKLSYVKGFKSWGWIVGTGIYIEDVQSEIDGMLGNLVKISVFIVVIALLLSIRITWQTIKIRNQKMIVEANLNREKETLESILESTPHGITLIDDHGKYLYVNSYFTSITGYTLEDIPTKKIWFEKVYPNIGYRQEVIEKWQNDNSRDGNRQIREFKIVCKTGETKHIEFRSSFLKDKVLSVLTDISFRKKAEETQREKDRLEGILEISGTVCHEMNQPLMSALGYFELMLMDISENDPNYARITKIQTQLERMSNITHKLMKISRYRTKKYLNGKILDLNATSDLEDCGTKSKVDDYKTPNSNL